MQSDLHTGELINALDGRRYTILETLGSGGFGSVYRARLAGGSGFVRPVAIKVLHPEAGGHEELSQRFRDEARLLGLLRHRALVQVLDLIPYRDGWALVMEYVPGADVAALLAQGPLPTRCAAEIIAEVASALAVAHAATDPETGEPLGLIHRDVKPANIRLSPEGEVKLLDFGVAHARFSLREAQTRSLAFGSMGYLAPERLEGTDLPASDIYALGVVLVECLRGGLLGPMPLEPRRHQNAVVNALTPLWPEIAGQAGQALFGLCEAMLHYDPEWRPSAAVVEDRLREIVPLLPGPWLRQWAPQAGNPPSATAPGRKVNLAESANVTGKPQRDDSRPWASRELAAPVAVEDPPATEWVSVASSAPSSRPFEGTLATERRSSRVWIWAGAGGMTTLFGIAVVVTVATQAPLFVRSAGEPPLASDSTMSAALAVPAMMDAVDPPGGPPPEVVVQAEVEAEPDSPPPASVLPSPPGVRTTRPAVQRKKPAASEEELANDTAPATASSVPVEVANDAVPVVPVEPEPEPEPEPERGTISIQGDHLSATLTNKETGEDWKPGRVPPGIYTVRVQITPERELSYGDKEIQAGETVSWTCSAEAQACRLGLPLPTAAHGEAP